MLVVFSRNWIDDKLCQEQVGRYFDQFQNPRLEYRRRMIFVRKDHVNREILVGIHYRDFANCTVGSPAWTTNILALADYIKRLIQAFEPGAPSIHSPAASSAEPSAASSAEPSAASSAEPAQSFQVDAAVFCPPRVLTKSTFLVQVHIYQTGAAAEAVIQAHEVDAQAVRRGSYAFPLDILPGTRVDVRLEMPDLEITEPDAVILWRGRITSAQFEVVVPSTKLGNTIGRVRFAVAGIPAGTLRFTVEVVAQDASAEPAACRVNAVRYHRAFASYSSEDRGEVLRRVQAFRIAGLSVFQDILELDPGERWERALYLEIDLCDVFLLFWSRAAAASEWVAKEIDYALNRKRGDDERPPAIQPVPIEGPPPIPPPAALRHLHFNDALLAHIKAASAQNSS
jgi:hypothetical protein